MNKGPTPSNVFAGAFTNRLAQVRKDRAWLKNALTGSDSRFLPVYRSGALLTRAPPAAALLRLEEARPYMPRPSEMIFLGRFNDHDCFTFDVGRHDEAPEFPRGEFHGLRLAGSLLPPGDASLVAYALAMVLWHRRHRFCGRCGNPTGSRAAGHLRVCSGAECGRQQFPRVDPAVIVLVHDRESCLLGRQPTWDPGRYSTVAGFVEPGESLEDAVRREVLEETGIEVGGVFYHSSQPWPFPSSLMLGFTAEPLSRDIHLIDQELEDAQWFTRERIMKGEISLPPPLSIAFRLIEHWFNQEPEADLAAIAGRSSWR